MEVSPILIVVAPVAPQVRVTLAPGAGEIDGLALKEVTFGSSELMAIMKFAIALPA